MSDDWFEEGKQLVLNQIAEDLNEDISVVSDVYSKLVDIGLIDYDVEKDIFWDWLYDEEN